MVIKTAHFIEPDFTINNCAVILLAAGASRRLGQPKQLLKHNGKSFLQTSIDVIKDTVFSPVIVVLGANADSIAPELEEEKVHLVNNEDWEEGIASSIRCGISAVKK